MFIGGARDAARAVSRSWWRLALVQLLLTLAIAAVAGLVAVVLRAAASDLYAWAAADPSATESRAVGIASLSAVVLLALSLPLAVASLAASARLADLALAGGGTRLGAALRTGLRATPQALAAVAIALALLIVTLVLAPVLSVIGLVGLAVLAVRSRLRRPSGGVAAATWRRWIVLAVPFGALWRVAAPVILLIPAAVLERAWPVRALRAADRAAAGHRWVILGCWSAAVAAVSIVVGLLVWLAALGGGDAASSLVGGVLQLLAVPIPVVVAVALYRRGAGPTGRVYPAPLGAPSVARTAPTMPVMARVATAIVVSLVVPLGVVATTATAASAAPPASSARLSITVTSAADTTDATALSTQRDSCATGGRDCTLRAALALAEQAAADGSVGATIDINGGPTIALTAPLTFAPDALAPTGGGTAPIPTPSETPPSETPPAGSDTPAPEGTPAATVTPAPTEAPAAPVETAPAAAPASTGTTALAVQPAMAVQQVPAAAPAITAGLLEIVGHGTVLDGGGVMQILSVTSEYWNLSVASTTFMHGYSSTFAGGLLAGVPQTTLTGVVVSSNSAGYGGAGVFARGIDVSASSFLDNTATGWSSSTLGGAIRATGTTTVTNSTFGGNSIGDQYTTGTNQGTDVYADADMTVVNSTFVDSRGGSLASPNATSSVRNSVFSTDRSQGAFVCSGRFTGANNVMPQGDSSCPGTTGQRLSTPVVGARSTAGGVPVYPLVPTGNPAVRAGSECPATDALGTARPAQGCDLGAVEIDGGTATTASVEPDGSVFGRATFRAVVTATSGAQPVGSVTFTVGGQTYGPITVTPGAGGAAASVVVSGLRGGTSYDYSAAFTAAAPFRDSAAATQSYAVSRQAVDVTLACATGTPADVCTGTDWVMTDAATLSLAITAADDRAGSVVIAADPAGATVLAGPVAVADGVATIDLSGSALGHGQYRLYALYTSDDGQHAGTPAQQPTLSVRRAATVSLTVAAPVAVYGDGVAGTATVTVTGVGPAPTGRVTVGGHIVDLGPTGTATVDISRMAIGTTAVSARYEGDAVYAPVTSRDVPFAVTAATTQTRITGIAPQGAQVGQALTVGVTVSAAAPSTADPFGTLKVLSDGAEITGATVTRTAGSGQGVATFAIVLPADALVSGTHALSVVFIGEMAFGDSAAAAQDVTVAAAATTTTLTTSGSPLTWDGQVALTATVDAPTTSRVPGGSIVFSAGTTVLGTVAVAACAGANPDGCATASLTVPARTLGLGSVALTARYTGGGDFAGSASAAVATVVERATPTLTLTAPRTAPFGSASSIAVRVAAGTVTPTTGTVVVTATGTAGTVTLGTVTLVDGEGTLVVAADALPVGDYALTAQFAGDTAFAAASATASLTVRAANTNTAFTTGAATSVPFGGSLDVGVTVSNTDLGHAPEGVVVLTWQGIEVGRTTLSAADDTSSSGIRRTVVTARFGEPISFSYAGLLKAQFIGAPGFGDSAVAPGGSVTGALPVTVTPLQAVVSVTTTAVLGSTLGADVTVALPGAPAGYYPQGQIVFEVTSGHGTSDTVNAPVVNGRATLAGTRLGAMPVDIAGGWTVRARYLKSDPDTRYEVVAPNDFAFSAVQVGAGTSAVTVTAPATVDDGMPLTLPVRIAGAVSAGGTVSLFGGGANIQYGDAAPVVNGSATLSVTLPAVMPLGTATTFEVRYSGDGTLDASTSAPFTVTLVPAATTVTLSTAMGLSDPVPGLLTGKVTYVAHTGSARGPVDGFVTLTRDSIPIASGRVDENGYARLTVTPDVVWAGSIVATFRPSAGRMALSTASLAHSWIAAPAAVTLFTENPTSAGGYKKVTASVRYATEQQPYAFADALPARAPNGQVTIDDGAGATCIAYLQPDAGAGPLAATGSCYVAYRAIGSRALAVSYSGDEAYAPAAITHTVSVGRGTPSVNLYVTGTDWAGSSTLPVRWEVRGPSQTLDGGTVTVLRGDTVVCTSLALSGSCDVALPAFADRQGALFTLRYSGTALWAGDSAQVQGQVVTCVPLGAVGSSPQDSATVTLFGSPNCAGGTGYLTNDVFRLSATAAANRAITGVAINGVLVNNAQISGDGKTANLETTPWLTQIGGVVQPMTIDVRTDFACVPVVVGAAGIADRLTALNMVRFTPQRGCNGGAVTVRGGNYLVPTALVDTSFKIGSTVPVSIDTAAIPAHMQFVGWRGMQGPNARATKTDIVITPTTTEIIADFAPICYAGIASAVQPAGGTITLDTPAPNCTDPVTGVQGWLWGTRASGVLTDALYGARTFFESWSGDTSRVAFGSEGWSTDAATRKPSYHRSFSYSITDKPFQIAASYGTCVQLSSEIRGDTSGGTLGSIRFDTPSNCPAGKGQATAPWYRAGTSVGVTAVSGTSKLGFLGWSGFPLPNGEIQHRTVSTVLVADTTAVASYGSNSNCRPLSVSAQPAGALTLDTTFSLGANACDAAYHSGNFFDQGVSGNGILINARPATPAAQGAEVVFAWATSPPGSGSGQAPTISNVWSRSSQLNELFYGNSQVVAYACEFVKVDALVTALDGTPVAGAGAANNAPAATSQLKNFVGTTPADCATGGDPRSGWGGYAWQVGTQLMPIVTADPVAYKFLGWSGDVTGTGETPNAPVNLVGAGHTAEGSSFHYSVRATFQAICYTLSLSSDAEKLEVITAPNCPGVDAAKRMYLGGTNVVVHAADAGGALFRNWVSGTDAIDADPRWASVSMTSDKTLVPYYSSKSVAEQLSTFGGQVGDVLAVSSKKLVGIASATMASFMKLVVAKVSLVTDGIGYLAQGLELLGVHGAAIDGMKTASSMMNSVLSMFWAPMDCMTAWSAGGTDTVFYAVQNLVGSLAVAKLSADAATKTVSNVASAIPKNSLTQLLETAQKVKATVVPIASTAASTLTAAKASYDAGKDGKVGVESSAYAAWGSQQSLSVYTSCMSGKAGSAMDTINTSLDAVTPIR